MSADIYLYDDRGHREGEWNITFNLSPMLCAAAGIEGRWYDRLEGADGPTGQKWIHDTLKVLEADPARFEAMNPPNGWGTYDGLVSALHSMVAAVPEWPTKWELWL